MEITGDGLAALDAFARDCAFDKGCLVLDLDGTTLMESGGKVFVSKAVSQGVRAVHDLGRPIVINTLRFPLSVINSVGEEWYAIADQPILTILLNGSVSGYIRRKDGRLEYEELETFPLKPQDIDQLLAGMEELLAGGVDDLLLFFYSRDWREGERLWTPRAERIPPLKAKYLSASEVFSSSLPELGETLRKRELCMACLFIDRPEDTLMAYQHSRRNSFITAKGVDKAFGTRQLARKLEISLDDSLGAGDTEMDTFLNVTGLSVIVGQGNLPYRGTKQTTRVSDPQALGALLSRFASIIAERKLRA